MRNLTFARALAALDRTRSGAQADKRLRALIVRAGDDRLLHDAPREPILWILHAR